MEGWWKEDDELVLAVVLLGVVLGVVIWARS
jgi:hypothetical protein